MAFKEVRPEPLGHARSPAWLALAGLVVLTTGVASVHLRGALLILIACALGFGLIIGRLAKRAMHGIALVSVSVLIAYAIMTRACVGSNGRVEGIEESG